MLFAVVLDFRLFSHAAPDVRSPPATFVSTTLLLHGSRADILLSTAASPDSRSEKLPAYASSPDQTPWKVLRLCVRSRGSAGTVSIITLQASRASADLGG